MRSEGVAAQAHRGLHPGAATRGRVAVPFRPTRIGVVVPAKNERELLPACLEALLVAARQVILPVTIVVVLDDCTDDSRAVVTSVAAENVSTTIRPLSVTANSVGIARAAGMSAVLDGIGRYGTWLATTDADSTVPPHWLSAQLEHAAAGARVVVGTIDVTDWGPHDQAVRERALTDYGHPTDTRHRHIHGANLSFTADAYHAAGGFPPRTFDEDVALVEVFTANDEPITWTRDLPVHTSARRHARTPHGFATYLSTLDHQCRRRPSPPSAPANR